MDGRGAAAACDAAGLPEPEARPRTIARTRMPASDLWRSSKFRPCEVGSLFSSTIPSFKDWPFQNHGQNIIREAGSACGLDALYAGLELGDLDQLVGGDVAEDLSRSARGPVDLQAWRPDRPCASPIVWRSGLAPKLLPEVTWRWIVSGLCSGGHDLDPGADGGAVALGARELDRQPVVSLAGVLKQHVVILVAVDGTAGLDEDVDVAVVIPVSAGDAVAFLKVAGARACR